MAERNIGSIAPGDDMKIVQKNPNFFFALASLLLAAASTVPLINSDKTNWIVNLFFFFAILIIIFVLLVLFGIRACSYIAVWLGGDPCRIRRPTDEEISDVYTFAKDYFGDSVTDAETIRQITKKYKDGLKLAKRRKNGKNVVVGYFFFFPINKTTVEKIRKYEFAAKDLSAADVASRPQYGYAFYIGAIAAEGWRARAQMLGALKANEEIAKYTRSKAIYARAASKDGLRVLRKHGFYPVHEKADDVDCFFKKKIA